MWSVAAVCRHCLFKSSNNDFIKYHFELLPFSFVGHVLRLCEVAAKPKNVIFGC